METRNKEYRDLWKESEEVRDAIKDLAEHPGFKYYMERLRLAELEALRQAIGKGDTDFTKGIYYGIAASHKLLLNMVEEVGSQDKKQFVEVDLDPDDGHRREL